MLDNNDTNTEGKIVKETMKKSFGFIIKIIVAIVILLCLLVGAIYIIFDEVTSDQWFAPGWDDWLENDDEIKYD